MNDYHALDNSLVESSLGNNAEERGWLSVRRGQRQWSGDGIDVVHCAAVGSVDDGKSTLIGRLLYDSGQLTEDQLVDASRTRGRLGHFDPAKVTDGLRAEREQGITIDVGYRYASFFGRRVVIADCPGHVQYTANTATGASKADVVLALVDATRWSTDPLTEQTKLHLAISSLFGVSSLIACINKMDLVGWSEEVFHTIAAQVRSTAGCLGMHDVTVIPISALHGDNVVRRSELSFFYSGPTVAEALGRVHTRPTPPGTRLPIQLVLRKDGSRRYAGMLVGGRVHVNQEVVVLPFAQTTRVRALFDLDQEVEEVTAPASVAVELEDDLDVGRGDLIAAVDDSPEVVTELSAILCFFDNCKEVETRKYLVKHTTRITAARISSLEGILCPNDLSVTPISANSISANSIVLARVELATPLAVDSYASNPTTGSFILVEQSSNAVLAAGIVGLPSNLLGHNGVAAPYGKTSRMADTRYSIGHW